MSVRGLVPVIMTLAIVATLGGVLQASQIQFTQSPTPPRYPTMPGQRPGQPLFPVPRVAPDEVPNPSTPPNQVEAVIPKPRIVCGMTLIPAPKVEPKTAEKPETEKPKNPTRYTIRPVQPSICW
jgi:hypothetical protein